MDLPRGEAPNGSFYNAGKIEHDFFKEISEADRDESLRNHMPFLHSILYAKIETAIIAREKVRKKREEHAKRKKEVNEANDDRLNDGETNRLDSMRRQLNASSGEDMEGVSHLEATSSREVERKKLVQVSILN